MGDKSMGHSLFHATTVEEDNRIALLEEQQCSPPPQQEIVHREQQHHHHVHAHRHIHKRQQSSADTNAVETLQVTSTVSLIQQVDVDTAGSILSTQVVPEPTSSTLPAATDVTTSIESGLVPSNSIFPSPSILTVAASSTVISIDSTTTSQPLSGVTSTPSTNAFSTFTAGSNSSTTSTGSSISSGSVTNLSTTNLTLSSSTSLSSAISSSSFSTTSHTTSTFSATSFISSIQSSSSTSTPTSSISSISQTGSSGVVIGIAPTGSSASSAATASSTSGASGSNNVTTAPTGTLIAGVFGGIAGVGLILVFLLFLVKWHKRRLASNQALPGSSDGGTRDPGNPANRPPSQNMSERPRFAMPAGLANLASFKPNRASRQTMRTVSSTAESERGFVRVSGRKIRSVLESGGDGYGDPPPPLNINIEGASFYQDSHGIYGGHGSPTSPIEPGIHRHDSGIPNLRPSPARTPVIEHPASFSELNLAQPPPRPDGGGLSRPSLDGSNAGSHASRFTEDI